jgi:hypothetical protein
MLPTRRPGLSLGPDTNLDADTSTEAQLLRVGLIDCVQAMLQEPPGVAALGSAFRNAKNPTLRCNLARLIVCHPEGHQPGTLHEARELLQSTP